MEMRIGISYAVFVMGIILNPLCSNAVASLPSGTTGAVNLMSKMPSNPNSNLYNPTVSLYNEQHSQMSANCSSPVYNCSPGGTLIPGSSNSASNTINGQCNTAYTCFVPYPPAPLRNNSNVTGQMSTSGTNAGWYLIPNTKDASGNATTDYVTLLYPNGWPKTTFKTLATFGYGGPPGQTSGGGGVKTFQQIHFLINGGNENDVSESSDDFYLQATTTAVVAPNSVVTVYKWLKGAVTVSYCQGTFLMPPVYEGTTVYVDCCPDGTGGASQINNAEGYTNGNQNWGPGGLPSVIFYSNTNTSVNCGSAIGGGANTGSVNVSILPFVN